MKRNTQIAVAGLLLAVAALSSVKSGVALNESDVAGAACCPLVQSLDDMSLTTSTNRRGLIDATNSHPATNHP